MGNQANRLSAEDFPLLFEVGQMPFDPQPAFHMLETKNLLHKTDFGSDDNAVEIALLLGGVADPCARAIQALRDVRHLLPPEGVAIVDALLGRSLSAG